MTVVWLFVGAFSSVSRAHPLSDRIAAQTTVLTVGNDVIDVDFYADVPNELVATARGRRPDRATNALLDAVTTELATGLLLTVDGKVVSMRLRGEASAPRPSSEHTVGFTLRLSAPLPAGAEEVALLTSNLLDARNVFAQDVRVGPRHTVRGTSVLGLRDGRIVRDDTLRWQQGEAARTTSVTLGAAWPRLWPAFVGASPEPVRAARALTPGLADHVRPTVLTPGSLALGTAVAFVLGLPVPPGPRRKAALVAVAFGLGLLGVVLGTATGLGEVVGVLFVGLAGFAQWIAWSRESAGGLVWACAAGALAATTHHLGPVVVVVAGFAVGAGMPPIGERARRWVGAVALALALTAVCLRGSWALMP